MIGEFLSVRLGDNWLDASRDYAWTWLESQEHLRDPDTLVELDLEHGCIVQWRLGALLAYVRLHPTFWWPAPVGHKR